MRSGRQADSAESAALLDSSLFHVEIGRVASNDPATAVTDHHKRCLRCGYIIENLHTDRCPECGKAFDPNDASTYSDKLPFIAWAFWRPWLFLSMGAARFSSRLGSRLSIFSAA